MNKEKHLIILFFFIFVLISYFYTDLIFIDSNYENSFHNFYRPIEILEREGLIFIIFDEPSDPSYNYIYFVYNCAVQENIIDWYFLLNTKEVVNYLLPNSLSVSLPNKYSEYLELYNQKLQNQR